MKITDNLKSAGAPLTPAATPAGARGAEKAATAQGAPDRVRLSPQGQALAAATSPRHDGAAFDTHKVELIKQAIADGKFQVDAGKVADGLLDTVRDLLRARPR